MPTASTESYLLEFTANWQSSHKTYVLVCSKTNKGQKINNNRTRRFQKHLKIKNDQNTIEYFV